MNPEDIRPVAELLDLEGQVALVTGASGNIGSATAARLSEAGARIVAHYHRNRAAAEALVERLGGGDCVAADLREEAAVDALFERYAPAIVVNNAARQPVEALETMSHDAWRDVLGANLDAAFLVTQAAAAHWRRDRRPGIVVNIASIEGVDPAAGHAHYATSKAGLLMFTRAAALEYGGDDIRVNAVSPGLVDRDGLATDWPEGVERWRSNAPLARLGTANDVADAVLFLVSPAARWISGANLVVDGGMSARSRW
ncbi:MAG: SDR family NAD(P)-dependent oxidoreductase [Pseudomonadota bacterium]